MIGPVTGLGTKPPERIENKYFEGCEEPIFFSEMLEQLN